MFRGKIMVKLAYMRFALYDNLEEYDSGAIVGILWAQNGLGVDSRLLVSVSIFIGHASFHMSGQDLVSIVCSLF